MERKPAEWRGVLRDNERAELERAEALRDTAADNLRAVTKKLKDRCIKRMRRAQEGGDDG
jgi:hypothetical protein